MTAPLALALVLLFIGMSLPTLAPPRLSSTRERLTDRKNACSLARDLACCAIDSRAVRVDSTLSLPRVSHSASLHPPSNDGYYISVFIAQQHTRSSPWLRTQICIRTTQRSVDATTTNKPPPSLYHSASSRVLIMSLSLSHRDDYALGLARLPCRHQPRAEGH